MSTTNNMYANYYIGLIKKAVSLKESIFEETQGFDPVERANIYKLCLMGLLREGYPFKIVEHERIEEVESSDVSDSKKKKSPELYTPNIIKEKYVSFVIDGNGYEAKIADMKKMFGKSFSEIIEEKNKINGLDYEDEEEYSGPVIQMADINFDEEEKPVEVKKEVKTKEKVPNVEYIKNDLNYKNDKKNQKQYTSFLFNTHDLTLQTEKGIKEYKCFVYPLTMNDDDCMTCEIMAILATPNLSRVRSKISSEKEKDSKGVIIDMDDTKYIIRGNWKDGVFNSSVSVYSSEYETTNLSLKSKRTIPTDRTSSFYMRINGKDGTYLDIFPLGVLKNNGETGIAPLTAMYESPEGKLVITPKSDGTITMFFDGSQKNIYIFWRGNDLLCDIEDANKTNVYS